MELEFPVAVFDKKKYLIKKKLLILPISKNRSNSQ